MNLEDEGPSLPPVPSQPTPLFPQTRIVESVSMHSNTPMSAIMSDADWLFSPCTLSSSQRPQTSFCQTCASRSSKLSKLTSRVEELASYVSDLSNERDSLLVRLANTEDLNSTLKLDLSDLRSRLSSSEKTTAEALGIQAALEASLKEAERKLALKDSAPSDVAAAFQRSELLYIKKIEELESMLTANQRLINHKEAEVDALNTEVDRLRQQSNSTSKTTRAMEQELNLLRTSVSRLRSGYSSSKSLISRLLTTLPSLETSSMIGYDLLSRDSELQSKLKELQEVKGQNSELLTSQSKLIAENQSLSEQLSTAHQSIVDLNQKYSSDSSSVSYNLIRLEVELENERKSNSKLTTQLEESATMLADFENTLTLLETNQNQLEQVKIERDQLEAKIGKYESTVKNLNDTITTLSEKYSTAKKRIKIIMASNQSSDPSQSLSFTPEERLVENTVVEVEKSTVNQESQTESISTPITYSPTSTSPSQKLFSTPINRESIRDSADVSQLKSKLIAEKKSSKQLALKLKELHSAFSALQSRFDSAVSTQEAKAVQQADVISTLKAQNEELKNQINQSFVHSAPLEFVEYLSSISRTERARLAAALDLSASSKLTTISQVLISVVKDNEKGEKKLEQALNVVQSFTPELARKMIDLLIAVKDSPAVMEPSQSNSNDLELTVVIEKICNLFDEIPNLISESNLHSLNEISAFSDDWKVLEQLKPHIISCFGSISSIKNDEASIPFDSKLTHIRSLIKQHLSSISEATARIFEENSENSLKEALSLLSRTQATLTVALQLDSEDDSEYLDSVSENMPVRFEMRSNAIEAPPSPS
ncbi:hypothetical protein RCL1_004092 [Eukaryota sp. TZLM3-RCL]